MHPIFQGFLTNAYPCICVVAQLLQFPGALRAGYGAPWHSDSGGRCWGAGAAASKDLVSSASHGSVRIFMVVLSA